jgi:hypothetical protein
MTSSTCANTHLNAGGVSNDGWTVKMALTTGAPSSKQLLILKALSRLALSIYLLKTVSFSSTGRQL